jgi:hypothetical protein
MKAPMGKKIQEILSDSIRARRLTSAIIANSGKSDVITIENILPGNQSLTLKRISLRDR